MNLKNLYQLFCFSLLLFQCFSVFALKDKRIKELQKFVNEKNIAKIDKVLKKNIEDEKKCLLFFSVSSNNKEILSYLIEKGMDVNTFDENYNTPLIVACSSDNSEEMVNFLLQKGAAINSKNSKSETPLIAAIRVPNNYKIVKLLLEAGVNIDAPITTDGKTALMFFSEQDNTFGLKSLIENGAKINLKDNNGNTALYYAIYHNSFDATKYLLENNADIKSNDVELLIKTALDKENKQIVSLLLEKGINSNIEIKIEDKKIPILEYSIVCLHSLDITEILVKAGADVNKTVVLQGEEHTLLYYVTDIS